MVNFTSAEENIIQSDRVPVFLGTNRLYLKQGVQSTDSTIDIPNEILQEQGNENNRGVAIQSPNISFSLSELVVDIDIDQMVTSNYATVGASEGNSTLSAGAVIFSQGQSDKLNRVVVSMVSGGNTLIGEGAIVASATGQVITLATEGDNINLAVGMTVILQEEGSLVNSTVSATNVISILSGTKVTLTGTLPTLPYSGAVYIFRYYSDPVETSANVVTNGYPLTTVKGIEVFFPTTIDHTDATVHLMSFALTYAGSAEFSYQGAKSTNIDALMVVNDNDDNLIGMRYFQDLGLTTGAYNASSDGNMTRTLDANTGKSLFYNGYVNRRSMVRHTELVSATALSLATANPIFKGGTEDNKTIPTNTTFNENDFVKQLLKVVTINSSGTRKVWKEVNPTTTPSSMTSRQYLLSTTNIYFGETLSAETRIEITYLLSDLSTLATADEYNYDANAFEHPHQPNDVDGRYVPVTINTSNFDNRIDGIESTDFSIALNRDYYNNQGFTSARVKPANTAEITGSINVRAGFNQIIKVLNEGSNSDIAEGDLYDASTAANYTNNNNIPMYIRLYDPEDNATVLATYRLPGIQITNQSDSVSVGSDNTQSYSFTEKSGLIYVSR